MTRADVVGIVGAGAFGTALANRVASAGRQVVVWSSSSDVVDQMKRDRRNDRLPEVVLPTSLEATSDPEELARRARFIVVSVRSTYVRDRVRELGDYLDGSHLVVHSIGALASPGDRTVTEVLQEETPVKRVGALAGFRVGRELAQPVQAAPECEEAIDFARVAVGFQFRRRREQPFEAVVRA